MNHWKLKLLALIYVLGCVAQAAAAEQSCGRYALTGKLAPEGVVLFAGTPNERLVRVAGLGVAVRTSADHIVMVRIRRKFSGAPSSAELISREGLNRSVSAARRGFKLVSPEPCE